MISDYTLIYENNILNPFGSYGVDFQKIIF